MYSILNEEKTIVNFRKADSLKRLANIRIAYKLKKEGLTTNSAGALEYLNSWLEETEEATSLSQVVDLAAANLVYSNIFFFHLSPSGEKNQISSEERDEVYTWTVRILDHIVDSKK
jgi:hypothetical protein